MAKQTVKRSSKSAANGVLTQKIHVVSSDNGRWAVIREGTERASKRFENQKEAITWARDAARRNTSSSELVVHGRDGMIKSKSTYGQDPYPPRG